MIWCALDTKFHLDVAHVSELGDATAVLRSLETVPIVSCANVNCIDRDTCLRGHPTLLTEAPVEV